MIDSDKLHDELLINKGKDDIEIVFNNLIVQGKYLDMIGGFVKIEDNGKIVYFNLTKCIYFRIIKNVA